MTPRRTRHSLSAGFTVTPGGSSKPPRCFSPTAWLLDASLPIPRVLAGQVPRLPRYYQGTATSCRPSRRASFPSLGGTTGARIFRSRRRCVRQRRAWGWSPGIPVREFFRGDDRISQVPGEPQFPFAHVLRPRPAETSLTTCGTLAWPPLSERRRRRREDFRGSIAWLSGSPPTYHGVGYPSPRKAGFQVLVRLSWAGFYPQGSYKRFSTHFMCVGLLFQASWHNPIWSTAFGPGSRQPSPVPNTVPMGGFLPGLAGNPAFLSYRVLTGHLPVMPEMITKEPKHALFLVHHVLVQFRRSGAPLFAETTFFAGKTAFGIPPK